MERFMPLFTITNSTGIYILIKIPPPHTLEKHKLKFGRTQNYTETLSLQASVPTSISHSPKLPLVFLQLYGNTENVFYFISQTY